jgi:hypothetical protein
VDTDEAKRTSMCLYHYSVGTKQKRKKRHVAAIAPVGASIAGEGIPALAGAYVLPQNLYFKI